MPLYETKNVLAKATVNAAGMDKTDTDKEKEDEIDGVGELEQSEKENLSTAYNHVERKVITSPILKLETEKRTATMQKDETQNNFILMKSDETATMHKDETQNNIISEQSEKENLSTTYNHIERKVITSPVLKLETENRTTTMHKDETQNNTISMKSDETLDYIKEGAINHLDKVAEESAVSPLQLENGDGIESIDTKDGLLKYLKMCGGGKAKLLDEDDETYGFTEESKSSVRKSKRKKRPTLYRSSNVYLPPTPLSVHYKEISREPLNFLSSSSQHKTNERVSTSSVHVSTERSHQQESALFNEIVDENQYNFSYPQRGHMVLIVNDKFLRQTPREGAIWDLQKTKQIATKLGFRIFNSNNCRNLTKKETIAVLRESQNLDHSDSDCFMFVISTHGLEMPNPRVKGKLDHVIVCADDQLIYTSNILDLFSDRNCPTLKNKPKLFFIQACRGDKYDEGSELLVIDGKGNEDRTDIHQEKKGVASSDRPGQKKQRSFDETDTKPSADSWAHLPSYRTTASAQLNQPSHSQPGNAGMPYNERNLGERACYSESHIARAWSSGGAENPSTSQSSRENNIPLRPYPVNETPSLKCDNDFLVMYAIPPGFFAWRNTVDGSWMLDYLHKTIMSYDMKKPQDFLKLLRKVSRRMSQRQTNTPSDKRMHAMKAIPVIEHKLDKDIIFKPKAAISSWIRHDTTLLV